MYPHLSLTPPNSSFTVYENLHGQNAEIYIVFTTAWTSFLFFLSQKVTQISSISHVDLIRT